MKGLLCVLACAALPAAVWGGPETFALRSHTLPNGLRVLLAPDSLAMAVSVGVWYRAGTRDERPGRSGVAFLVELLATRGPAGEACQRRIAGAGGTFTSLTTSDYTGYQTTVPGEQLELALEAEAQRMASLEIGEDAFRPLRDLAVARLRQRARTPGAAGLDRLYHTAFARHPYGLAAAVRPEDLELVSLEECRAFHRDTYAPGNAVLTVSGRFGPGPALAAIRRLFTAPRRATVTREPVVEPPQAGERRAEERAEGEAPLLLAGWPTVADSSADAAALELLAWALARGASSRLALRLVGGERTCTQSHGALDGRAEPALLYVALALRRDAEPEAVEAALLAEVERMRGDTLGAAELQRCRNQAEAAVVLNWQSVQNRGSWIGQGAVRLGDPRAVGRRLSRIRAVTADDIRRVARQYLAPERRNVVWVLPAGRGEGGSE